MKDIFIDLSKTLAALPTIHDEKYRDWFSIPDPDPVTDHLSEILWNQRISPKNWQAARLSTAADIFREKATGWKIVAKFYMPKTGKNALRLSEREYQRTQLAWECLNSDQDLRSVQPLGVWGGVLFLEFINGLTL